MYRVTITLHKEPVEEYPLRDELVTVGRGSENDIQLSDTTVSQRHARVLVSPGGLYIEDLGSTNGTYVNGQRIKRHRLKNGDQATIGQHRLNFDSAVEPEEMDDQESTLQMKPNTIEQLLLDSQTRHTTSPPPDSKAINWVAQDQNGIWWGFEQQPVADTAGWSNFQDTMKLKLKQESPNPEWRATLHKV